MSAADIIKKAFPFGLIFITFILAISTILKVKSDADLIEQNYSDVPSDMKLVLHIYRTSIAMALFIGILFILSIIKAAIDTNQVFIKIFYTVIAILFILSCILIGICGYLVKYNKGSNKSNPNNWINLGLATGIFGLISLLFTRSLGK